jgi:hypothetical protein
MYALVIPWYPLHIEQERNRREGLSRSSRLSLPSDVDPFAMCEPSHSSASPTPSSSQTTASPSDPLARPPTSNFTFGSPTKSARPVAPFPTSTSFDFLLPSTFSRTSPISFSPAVPAIESTREEGQEMNQGSKGEEQGTKGKVFEAEASEIASDMSSVVSTPSTSTSRPTLPTMPSSPPSQRTKPPSPFSFPSSSTPSIYTQALSVPYDKKDLLVDSYVDKVQKPLGGLVEIQHDDYLMSTTRQENEDLSRSPEVSCAVLLDERCNELICLYVCRVGAQDRLLGEASEG